MKTLLPALLIISVVGLVVSQNPWPTVPLNISIVKIPNVDPSLVPPPGAFSSQTVPRVLKSESTFCDSDWFID